MKGKRRAGVSSLAFLLILYLINTAQGFSEEPPNYNYDTLPLTAFTCNGRSEGRYFADPETDCQLFHICVRMNKREIQDFKFLCPNGTVFDQEHLVCNDYYQVVCHQSVGTNPLGQIFELYKLTAHKPDINRETFVPSRDPEFLGKNTIGEEFQAEEYNNNNFVNSNTLAFIESHKRIKIPSRTLSSPPVPTISTTTTSTTTTPTPTTSTTTTTFRPPFRSPIPTQEAFFRTSPSSSTPLIANNHHLFSNAFPQGRRIQAVPASLLNSNFNNNNNFASNNNNDQIISPSPDPIFNNVTFLTTRTPHLFHSTFKSSQLLSNIPSTASTATPTFQQQSTRFSDEFFVKLPTTSRPFNFNRELNDITSTRATTTTTQRPFFSNLINNNNNNNNNNNEFFSSSTRSTTQQPFFNNDNNDNFKNNDNRLSNNNNNHFNAFNSNSRVTEQQQQFIGNSNFNNNNNNRGNVNFNSNRNDFSPARVSQRPNFVENNKEFSPSPIRITTERPFSNSKKNDFAVFGAKSFSFPSTTTTINPRPFSTTSDVFFHPTTFSPSSFQKKNNQFEVKTMQHTRAQFLVRTTTQIPPSETTEEEKEFDTYGPTLISFFEPTKSPNGFNFNSANVDDIFEETTTTTTTLRPRKKGRRRLKKNRQRQFNNETPIGRRVAENPQFRERESAPFNRQKNEEIFSAEASVFPGNPNVNSFVEQDSRVKEITQIEIDGKSVKKVRVKKPKEGGNNGNTNGNAFGRRIRPFLRDHSKAKEQQLENQRDQREFEHTQAQNNPENEFPRNQNQNPIRRRRPLNRTPSTTTAFPSTSTTTQIPELLPSTFLPEFSQQQEQSTFSTYVPSSTPSSSTTTTSRNKLKILAKTSFGQSRKTIFDESKKIITSTLEPEIITASDEQIEALRSKVESSSPRTLKQFFTNTKFPQKINRTVTSSISTTSTINTAPSSGVKVVIKSSNQFIPQQQQQRDSTEQIPTTTAGNLFVTEEKKQKKIIRIVKKKNRLTPTLPSVVVESTTEGREDTTEFPVTLSPDYDYLYFNTDEDTELNDSAKKDKNFGKKKYKKP